MENSDCLCYFGSMITNNARHIRAIKCSTAMAKAALNNKKTPYISMW